MSSSSSSTTATTTSIALTPDQEAYIASVLGMKTPHYVNSNNNDNNDNDVDNQLDLLFQADCLWNLGQCNQALELLNKNQHAIANSKDANPSFRSFHRGLEHLCHGSLPEALTEFQAAAAATDHGLLKTFWTERAVNIAFWMACTGQMVNSAKPLQDLIESTPFAGGILAFCRHMEGESVQAEAIAKTAMEQGHDDPWTIHAVAHALMSQGLAEQCATWLEQNRSKCQDCNAFMKGHMEFHLALCYIDMENANKLTHLMDRSLWGGMSPDMQQDYWNAAGLLNVVWKAELRGLPAIPHANHYVQQALQHVTCALSRVIDTTKSMVFSLCIYRFTTGTLRGQWKKALSLSKKADGNQIKESDWVLAAVASAVSIVYHHESQQQQQDGGAEKEQGTNDYSIPTATTSRKQWEEAAKLLAPVVDKLNKLGASPEQREVLEDFVGVVGKNTKNSDGIIIIDLKSWYKRNHRPSVQFYETII